MLLSPHLETIKTLGNYLDTFASDYDSGSNAI